MRDLLRNGSLLKEREGENKSLNRKEVNRKQKITKRTNKSN